MRGIEVRDTRPDDPGARAPRRERRDCGCAPSTSPREADRRLFERLRDPRDPVDRDAVVARFLPLARRLAVRYRRPDEPFDDLFQVACFALVNAVERYDLTRGVAFSSYAVPTISGEIMRHFRDRTWAVRVPRDLQELALRVERTAQVDGLLPSRGAALVSSNSCGARVSSADLRPADWPTRTASDGMPRLLLPPAGNDPQDASPPSEPEVQPTMFASPSPGHAEEVRDLPARHRPPAPATLPCSLMLEDERATIAPIGRLDRDSVPVLEAVLSDAYGRGFARIVLDLRSVSFIDAAGVGLLLRWAAANGTGGPQASPAAAVSCVCGPAPSAAAPPPSPGRPGLSP